LHGRSFSNAVSGPSGFGTAHIGLG
jgi:hypothetical protein